MRLFSLFLLSVILLSCKSRRGENIHAGNYQLLHDSIRESSKAVDILYYRNFATSKMTILAAQYKSPKGIDSILSYFGSESMDTMCNVFSKVGPIGELLFYRDSSRAELIAGFDFTFDENCKGFYGIGETSTNWAMTAFGQKHLEELHNKTKLYWTK